MLHDKELKELRLLIESMQSGLVELFDLLSELRKRFEMPSEALFEQMPRILPLFSNNVDTSRQQENDSTSESPSLEEFDYHAHALTSAIEPSSEAPVSEPPSESTEERQISLEMKVDNALDPIALELKTGDSSANIILQYLLIAKDYLIDDDARKEKVFRDMDIVLRFLQARGRRPIRSDERENILKRMDRWKAHLLAYASSPAD